MMDFYDLKNLKKDIAQDNLYNFFDATFQYFIGLTLYQYVVNPWEEMRIDAICNKIYSGTDYCDFLLDLNGIDNPLNIMSNDVLLYVPIDYVNYFHIDETTAKALRNTYLNAAKISQQDQNRTAYVGNDLSLPPTFLQIPASSVNIVGNQISLGGNK